MFPALLFVTVAAPRPIQGDRLKAEMRWEGLDDLRNLNGKVLRLRSHLTNADLDSFWSESRGMP